MSGGKGTYFGRVFGDAVAFLKGMAVTLRWFFKPAVTVQYPDEKVQVSPRFRGMLVLDPDTCTSCTLCEQACPSDCIHIEAHQDPVAKGQRVLDVFTIDFAKCNFCRLCEEACPTTPVKSIRHGHVYEYSMPSRGRLLWDMVRGKSFDPADGSAMAGIGGKKLRELRAAGGSPAAAQAPAPAPG